MTPLRKPLAQCRVALLTSGGISEKHAEAWDPDARNDFRLDSIPARTASNGFQINDSYYGHSDA
jgi:D-proline reductase (dithiol) PrdB